MYCLFGEAADLTVKAKLKCLNMVHKHDLNDPFNNLCGGKHGDMKAVWNFVSAIVTGWQARRTHCCMIV